MVLEDTLGTAADDLRGRSWCVCYRWFSPRGALLSQSFDEDSQGTTAPLCTKQCCMTAVLSA
jgi:hypothetical protein